MMLGRTFAFVAVLSMATVARGGGFEVPDNGTRALSRGGAFIVLADDLSAIALNPGGLSRLRGTYFLFSDNLLFSHASFARATSVLPDGSGLTQGDPLATVHNTKELFPLGMMLAVGSDFGLPNWQFTLGAYGPNASGVQEWNVQGGQRYMLTSTDIALLYPTLSVAYGKKDVFGVGLSLQYVMMPKTKFSLVNDGVTGGALNPYYSPSGDVEATLDMSDMTGFTAQVGGWWRPTPWLEVGLSGRVVPIYLTAEGDITLANVAHVDGEPNWNSTQLSIKDINGDEPNVSLPITLPVIARAGLRYRHLEPGTDRELFDVELDVVYEAWSMMKGYDIDLTGEISLLSAAELPDVKIDKNWKDTVSVRLGGTWTAARWLGVSAGGFWESGATPTAYTHLDYPSFDRFGVGGGLRFQFYGVDFNVAYNHTFQVDRDVSELEGKVFQQRPISPCPANCGGSLGVPANAGHYESSFDQLVLGLQLHFDDWLKASGDTAP